MYPCGFFLQLFILISGFAELRIFCFKEAMEKLSEINPLVLEKDVSKLPHF